MSQLFEVFLGIITGIGGFLEVGSLATSAQAGSEFGFQLAWAILLGTVCLTLLVEMAGRLAAVSGHTIPEAMRDRFGATFFAVLMVVVGLVSFLVLASEIGGVCIALQLVSGVGFRWWAPAVAFAVWLTLWKGSFGFIEKAPGILGLVTLAFLVGALRLKPPLGEVAAHLLPSLPKHDPGRYWFLAVSIFGASVSPYLFYFYSSGAVEEGWDEGQLTINRVTATIGMGFGGTVALAALVTAAMVFEPRAIRVDRYEQIALLLATPLGRTGFILFVLSLGIACYGAALEIGLQLAYLAGQGLGWVWSKNRRPREAARFNLTYTVLIPLAALVMFAGVDPLKLTNLSVALTAVSLPLTVIPLIALMNDPAYVGDYQNRWAANTALVLISGLAFIVGVITLPLQLVGG